MFDDYIGQAETRHDVVAPHLLHGLAATLGVPVPSVLPPLWHWMLFQDWQPPDRLGPDGHPRRGGFLPPVHDLPRRMWAGGRVRFLSPLHPGDAVHRTSTILDVSEKQGATGRLVFVTVHHAITGPSGPAIAEEQDIVYRGADSPAAPPAPPAPEAPPGLRATVLPDPVLLFRYSALTGNGHRIHYDMDYARAVEGYPGLVVHGPLLALLALELPRRHAPTETVTEFAYRLVRPAFAGAVIQAAGHRNGAEVDLAVGAEHAGPSLTATATLGPTPERPRPPADDEVGAP